MPMQAPAHWSSKSHADMTPKDWRSFNAEHRLTIPAGAPLPHRTWDDMGLPTVLRDEVPQAWTTPTPAQMASSPVVAGGHDLVCIADTGTGKTAAFALASLHRMYRLMQDRVIAMDGGERCCRIVVIAPTRELVEQASDTFAFLSRGLGLRVFALFSGTAAEMQHRDRELRLADIVVATPDLLARRLEAGWGGVKMLIIDEADRTLAQFGEGAVRAVLAGLPPRQTLLYSATQGQEIDALINSMSHIPITVKCGPGAGAGRGVNRATHHVEMVSDTSHGARVLASLVDRELGRRGQTLIFVNTRDAVGAVTRALQRALPRRRRDIVGAHGEDRVQREAASTALRDGRAVAVVCTDLYGRGLDVPTLTGVVNYDLPLDHGVFTADGFIHRVGRVGRAGQGAGQTWTFITRDDPGRDALAATYKRLKVPVPAGLERELAAETVPLGWGKKQ